MTLLRFFWNQPVTVPPPPGGEGMDTGGGGRYMSSGTMYRLGDEILFLKIERYCGFPHDSNYRATERKVCLGPGTEIQDWD